MCYIENGVYKGYELDLLYRFAKENEYKIVINSENINNISIGCKNITIKEGIYFSDPILKSSSVVVIRKDSKRNILPIIALYGNFTEKKNNIIEIPVEIPDGNIKTSSCILPELYYNDTILLNCSVNNITENEQSYFNGGEIKYGKTNNRIKILYATLDVNNILNANNLFSDESILKQSDTSNLFDSNKTKGFNRLFLKKKSSKTAIIILSNVIPSVITLIIIIPLMLLVLIRGIFLLIDAKENYLSKTTLRIKNEYP